MIKICFVCTGNTCRSVMAERLMKKVLKEEGINDVKVFSKGLCATGQQISDGAKKALKKFKASTSSRKSVKLGKIDKNMLYVALTDAHKDKIASEKVVSFSSLTGKDVLDPYGQDDETYFLAASQIYEGVKNLFEQIKRWRDK